LGTIPADIGGERPEQAGTSDASKRFWPGQKKERARMVRRIAVEVGVTGGAIALLVGVLYVASTTYATNGTLTEQGGLIAIGGLALFVLGLGVAGFLLARTDWDAE
jgi:hypothetical protein